MMIKIDAYVFSFGEYEIKFKFGCIILNWNKVIDVLIDCEYSCWTGLMNISND